MNTEYLAHSVGCAHLLTVLWCFESSPALLKLTEGWIDCVTRDLWKLFEKSILHLWLFAFCFPFPSWKDFLKLNISVPCTPHWCTFPQNCKCWKVVSPKCLFSMHLLWSEDADSVLDPPWIWNGFSHVHCWGQGAGGEARGGVLRFIFFN